MVCIRSGIALALLFASAPSWANECLLPAGVKLAEGISTVAPEMAAVPVAHPYCLPADQALARLRTPVPASGAYVPLTKDDNTPWRFDMSQNGKRMTAVEFDAWMKAKGIRVATGKPATATTAPAETAAPPLPAPPAQTGK